MKHEGITEQIIGAFYNVYNKIGYGFAEKIYENSMLLELYRSDLNVQAQAPIKVYYRGRIVGEYFADLLVEQSVIVELKAVRTLIKKHEAQLLNYLKATSCEVGLLLNFGPEPEVIRKVFDNGKKGNLSWIEPDY